MTDAPALYLDDRTFGQRVLGIWTPSVMGARIALAVAVGVSCLIFAAASRYFELPILPGYDGSILCQPSPVSAFAVVAVALAVATLVGTVLAGAVRFEAGLFAAAFGLMAFSLRCGTMQSVLLEAGGNEAVFVRLAVELLILGIFLGGMWALLLRLARAAHGRPSTPQLNRSGLLNNLTATVAQTISTGIFMFLLCQSEAKYQALAAIGIASWLGSMIAYKYAPTRPSIWYWTGPLLVGLIGYMLAAMGQDTNLNIGSPAGTFAAFARPLPVDYASLGTAGAILGYWMMRSRKCQYRAANCTPM
ncbi:MAG: hypothetical protein ABSD28_21365 [Tepidisphaeraceae bacterium]